MKKIIATVLALASLILSALPVSAAECDHNYLRSFISANCTEKGHTLYNCRKCGYSYKIYNDEYDIPEGFYILASSVREENTLTVTVEMHNNPGLTAARLQVGYNAGTLAIREFINGSIWTEADFTGEINLKNNPLSVFTEDCSTEDQKNTNNGTYFTLIFDIIDPEGAYNMYFSHGEKDFHLWDNETSSIIPMSPTVISTVGKAELGDHSYTENVKAPTCTEGGITTYTCSFCNDTYTANITEALGHNWSLTDIPKEPTLKEEGAALYTCGSCGQWKIEAIPVLEPWLKGDLNDDKTLNSIDSNLMRRFLVGTPPSEQAFDAADMDCNGYVNAMDAFILKLVMAGKYTEE